jgi:hypothetical protein
VAFFAFYFEQRRILEIYGAKNLIFAIGMLLCTILFGDYWILSNKDTYLMSILW